MRKILLTLSLLTVFAARTAFAADQIDIDVDTTIEPSEAVGLVISATGTDQRLDATWSKSPTGSVTVTIPLKKGDRTEGTVVTAMIKGQDGNIAFGNTKAAWIRELSSSASSLPECLQQKAPKNIESDAGLVQSLVEVRSARRNYLQLKISNLLKGDLSKKLIKLERGFGMEQGKALDASLPPLELEDRLDRLEHAIINYRVQKKAPIAPKQAANEPKEEADSDEPQ